MQNKSLIIGGGGFIGSHLVHKLREHDKWVRVLGLSEDEFKRNLSPSEKTELLLGSYADEDAVTEATQDVCNVVHLAHSTVPATSMQDLTFDLHSNVVPLIHLLFRIRSIPHISRFVYVSSGGTVYGDPAEFEPLSEEHATRPISGYGLTKLMCEHYTRLILARSHIRAYIVRPANAYGENQNLNRNQGLIGVCLRALAKDSPFVLYGDGMIVRDYIYAGDLAEALARCMVDEATEPGSILTVNLGTGLGTTTRQLIEIIEKLVGKRLMIVEKPNRAYDCRYNVLDISKAGRILNWTPHTSLEEGILKTWQWIHQLEINRD